MQRFVFTVGALALVIGCRSAAPVSPSPELVPTDSVPAPEPKVEHEAMPVLEAFLEARWAREERAATFVVEEDVPHVGQLLEELSPHNRHDIGRLGLWHETRVIDVREASPGVAIATVDVWKPFGVERDSHDRKRVENELSELRKVVTDRTKWRDARRRLEDLLIPARYVERHEYRLIQTEEGWKIDMGWRHYPGLFDETEQRGRPTSADPAVFVGSEGARVQRRLESRNRKVDRKRVSLKRFVEDAEDHVKYRNYPRALEFYEKEISRFDVPDFVARRVRQLESDQERWDDIVAEFGLVMQVTSPRELSPRNDAVDVTLEHTGTARLPRVLTIVEAVYERDGRATGPAHLKYAIFEDVKPGSQSSRTIEYLRGVRVLRHWVYVIETGDSLADAARFPPTSDPALSWHVSHYTYGTTAVHTWLMEAVLAREARLDACPEWPEELVRAIVETDENGEVVKVSLSSGSSAFGVCAAKILREPRFPAIGEPRKVDVQLVPPGYWQRASQWSADDERDN